MSKRVKKESVGDCVSEIVYYKDLFQKNMQTYVGWSKHDKYSVYQKGRVLDSQSLHSQILYEFYLINLIDSGQSLLSTIEHSCRDLLFFVTNEHQKNLKEMIELVDSKYKDSESCIYLMSQFRNIGIHNCFVLKQGNYMGLPITDDFLDKFIEQRVDKINNKFTILQKKYDDKEVNKETFNKDKEKLIQESDLIIDECVRLSECSSADVYKYIIEILEICIKFYDTLLLIDVMYKEKVKKVNGNRIYAYKYLMKYVNVTELNYVIESCSVEVKKEKMSFFSQTFTYFKFRKFNFKKTGLILERESTINIPTDIFNFYNELLNLTHAMQKVYFFSEIYLFYVYDFIKIKDNEYKRFLLLNHIFYLFSSSYYSFYCKMEDFISRFCWATTSINCERERLDNNFFNYLTIKGRNIIKHSRILPIISHEENIFMDYNYIPEKNNNKYYESIILGHTTQKNDFDIDLAQKEAMNTFLESVNSLFIDLKETKYYKFRRMFRRWERDNEGIYRSLELVFSDIEGVANLRKK